MAKVNEPGEASADLAFFALPTCARTNACDNTSQRWKSDVVGRRRNKREAAAYESRAGEQSRTFSFLLNPPSLRLVFHFA